MGKSPLTLLLSRLLLLLLLQPVLGNTDDQISAQVSRGSFENPAARLRPRFRYWLPDAGVDVHTVQEDIESAGAIGAGGVEFVPYYNYGGQLGSQPAGANWSRDGFGTPAFKKMFVAALRTHKEAGLAMDFALGPNQGQDVPASPDYEGLQWDLVERAIQTLKQSQNVHSVSTGQVAAKLRSLRLRSQVAVQTNGTWYSTWREDARQGMDHAFVFCDTNASTGTLDIASTKNPVFLDPWTGEQKPVLNYQRHEDRVTIPFRLAGNQTVVIYARIRNAGQPPLLISEGYSLPPRSENGVVGRVELVPYADVKIGI